MSVDTDDAPVGSVVGVVNFFSSVTSARCRIFRRHGSPVFAASSLRNVFAQVDAIPLDRHSAGVADRFIRRLPATASESSFEPLPVFATSRDVGPSSR